MGEARDALGRVGNRLRTLPGEGVDHATSVLRDAIMQSLKKDTGGDRKLSGLGPRAVRQTVKVTKREFGNLVDGRVMAGPPRQRAPWFWLEEGTDPGRRRVRRGSRRHRGTRTTYYHPGTPAKQTWSDPVGRVAPSVERHFEQLLKKAMEG